MTDNTEHTPGEWTAAPQDQGRAFENICTVWSGEPGLSTVVAYVPTSHGGRDLPYEANARLIAQAPELKAENAQLKRRLVEIESQAGDATEFVLAQINEGYREALEKIAIGDGVYGAQAWEYKRIARAVLGWKQVGERKAS